MRQKNIFIIIMILAIIWVCFIFYMSSQTAVSSGDMSKSVTKAIVIIGEKVGVIKASTTSSELVLKRYDSIIRNIAHVGMYFVLACMLFSAFWLWGLNKKNTVIISFCIGFFSSIIDEINQMHFIGRNSGGVISEGMGDVYRDTFGICLALAILGTIRVLTQSCNRYKSL